MGRSDKRVVEGRERKREKKEERVFRKAGVEGVACTDRCQWTVKQACNTYSYTRADCMYLLLDQNPVSRAFLCHAVWLEGCERQKWWFSRAGHLSQTFYPSIHMYMNMLYTVLLMWVGCR